MGTHLIPREVDGEARILLIFTPKGFFGILIGAVPGILFEELFKMAGAPVVGYILLAICMVCGWVIGQMKMPQSRAFDLLRKTGGEYIKDIIKNYIKFRKTRKYYVYDADMIKNKK